MALALWRAADEDAHGAVAHHGHARGLRHADAGRLDAHRHTDSDGLAGLLPPADVRSADPLRRQLEQARVVTAVVDDGVEACLVRHVGRADQVAPAQLDRVETKTAGETVHHPLDREVAHRPPTSPNERRRRSVREARGHLHIERGQPIGGHRVSRHALLLESAASEVGTDRPPEPSAQSDEATVLVGGDLHVEIGAMRLARGVTVLGAVRNPADRPLEEAADRGSHDVFGIRVVLRPEAPAHVLGQRDHLRTLESKASGQRVAEHVNAADAGSDVQLLL